MDHHDLIFNIKKVQKLKQDEFNDFEALSYTIKDFQGL